MFLDGLRVTFLAVVLGMVPVSAAETVTVVIDENAPELEQFAASELADQFGRLFDVEVVTAHEVPDGSSPLVLVGSPSTNSAVKRLVAGDWPELTSQGLVIRSIDRGLVVGGGGPVATLHAVYELGHRFGIRYLLREDIDPDEKQPLKLSGFHVVAEPTFDVRTWRTIDEYAYGAESWGIEGHQRLLKQLAKLKFNSLMISVSPWQPFVHYESGDIAKQTGVLWHGDEFAVDGDTPYKPVFGGAAVFGNPDFDGCETYEKRTAAGTKLVRKLMTAAGDLGITAGISLSPLEFPKEFAPLLPGAVPTGVRNDLLVAPGAETPFDSEPLRRLVTVKLRAYLETYPDVARLYLKMPEAPAWHAGAAEAWAALGVDVPLEKFLADAKADGLMGDGDDARLRSNIVALGFLKGLLQDDSLLQGADGKVVPLTLTQIHPALSPVLDQVLPPDADALLFVDKTSRRVADKLELLSSVPTDDVRAQLYLTLADKGIGILPQGDAAAVAKLTTALKDHDWAGYCTRYWVLGELDPLAYYLSRAAYEAEVTPEAAYDDLFASVTGKPAAAESLRKCFGHIATADALMDAHDPDFAFPAPDMLTKHGVAEPVPEWWTELNEAYTEAMIEAFRSRAAADVRAKDYLYYYAKRTQFTLSYLAAVTAVREAALAKEDDDVDLAIEKYEVAIEAMYDAIVFLGEVARDQSDLGLMAVLSNYAYRPLLADYEKLLDETE